MPIDEAMDDSRQDEDLIPADTRRHSRLLDSRIQADGELSDSDDEGESGRRDHAHHQVRDSEPRSHSSEVESATGRQCGIGVGILSSGAAGSAHGARPSRHTNAVRPILSGYLRRLLKADLRLSNHPLLMAPQVIFRVISRQKRMAWWSMTIMEQVQKVNVICFVSPFLILPCCPCCTYATPMYHSIEHREAFSKDARLMLEVNRLS